MDSFKTENILYQTVVFIRTIESMRLLYSSHRKMSVLNYIAFDVAQAGQSIIQELCVFCHTSAFSKKEYIKSVVNCHCWLRILKELCRQSFCILLNLYFN